MSTTIMSIETSTDDGAADPRSDHLAARLAIETGCAARQSVGIADGDGRRASRPTCGPAGVVADCLTGLDDPDLNDACFQPYHGPHRIRLAGARVAAVEGVARPYEIMMRGGAKENAARIGEAAGHARKGGAYRGEGFDLPGVQGISGALGGDEMAHHERGYEAVEASQALATERDGLGGGQPQPVDPGVHMQCCRGVDAMARGERAPFGDFLVRAQDGSQPRLGVGRPTAGQEAVQHINRRGRQQRAHAPALAEMRDEEGLAAGHRQRRGGNLDAECRRRRPSGRRRTPRPAPAPRARRQLSARRRRVDGQHAPGLVGGRAGGGAGSGAVRRVHCVTCGPARCRRSPGWRTA